MTADGGGRILGLCMRRSIHQRHVRAATGELLGHDAPDALSACDECDAIGEIHARNTKGSAGIGLPIWPPMTRRALPPPRGRARSRKELSALVSLRRNGHP